MLLVLSGMWVVCIAMVWRESAWLLGAGMFVYMVTIPAVEAAEQTVLQRTVPYAKQGRVFGLAQTLELGAAPLSAFAIAPVAEFWLLPWMRDGGGEERLAWLLGTGEARGMAVVFILVSAVGMVATIAAFLSPAYRMASRSFAETPASVADVVGEKEQGPGADAHPAPVSDQTDQRISPKSMSSSGTPGPEPSDPNE